MPHGPSCVLGDVPTPRWSSACWSRTDWLPGPGATGVSGPRNRKEFRDHLSASASRTDSSIPAAGAFPKAQAIDYHRPVMEKDVPTCWTVIRGAAAGRHEDREEFARRYEPVVRAYLGARWANSPASAEIDDHVQEVFLECFRVGGVLARADSNQPGGFRAFLYGVIRIVALRAESRLSRNAGRSPASTVDFAAIPSDEMTLSRLFDREWATAQVRAAAELHQERARMQGDEALRRVEILRLRFSEGLPIRDIARRWGIDAETLHRAQTRARREFKQALIDVVRFQHPTSGEEIQRECEEILAVLAHGSSSPS